MIPFPYTPYETQSRLMAEIHDCIENSSVGFFESPTGTGKSLSAICSAGHWLRKEEKRILDAISESKKAVVVDPNDWLLNFTTAHANKTTTFQTNALQKYEDMKKRVTQSIERKTVNAKVYRPGALGSVFGSGLSVPSSSASSVSVSASGSTGALVDSGSSSSSSDSSSSIVGEPEDDEFVMDAYDSDDGNGKKKKTLVGEFDSDDEPQEDDNDDAGINDLELPQIFYCSRTHSQVSQFVDEIKKTEFKDFRCVTLGSRMNLCINPDLAHITSDKILSERCLEMAKKAKKKKQKEGSTVVSVSKRARTKDKDSGPCTYHNQAGESAFGYSAINTVRDIEELKFLGLELGVCPYYGTRRAVQRAHIVCMPYNLLLQEDAREAMGIKLKNKIVIMDEAHNIVDAVNQIHSADVTLLQLQTASDCVTKYLDRFRSVLGSKNLYYLSLLIRVMQGLCSVATSVRSKKATSTSTTDFSGASCSSSKQSRTTIMRSNELIFDAKLDNVNIFKLKRHISTSNIEKRIGGYCDHCIKRDKEAIALSLFTAAAAAAATADSLKSSKKNKGFSSSFSLAKTVDAPTPVYLGSDCTNALRSVLQLITCLQNDDGDGRIVISTETDSTMTTSPPSSTSGYGNVHLQFVLLNPSVHFEKIIKSARSVILLGGTMKPFKDLTANLAPNISNLRTFSCSHVVSPLNVRACVVAKGPSGAAFDFRHSSRYNVPMLADLASTIIQTCMVVPAGKVVFFTSYAYMDSCISSWRGSGLLDKLTKVVPLFVEPRGAGEVEKMWTKFSGAATKSQSSSPEKVSSSSTTSTTTTTSTGAVLFCVMGGKMSEGINFSDDLARCVIVIGMPFPDMRDPILAERLAHADAREAGSSKGVYEGMCLRVVNQSIGRSIRHVKDYASILLLDHRYADERVQGLLPGWIQNSLIVRPNWTQTRDALSEFFTHHTKGGKEPEQGREAGGGI